MNGITECYKRYAEKQNVSLSAAKEQFNAAVDVIRESIVEDGGVSIKGVFTLTTVERPERNGYNPITKEQQTFPAYKTVKCKVGNALKEELNG